MVGRVGSGVGRGAGGLTVNVFCFFAVFSILKNNVEIQNRVYEH